VTIDVTDGELQNIDLPILVITHKKEAPGMPGIRYFDVFWVTFTTKNWRNH
jgi:hypothetical protein